MNNQFKIQPPSETFVQPLLKLRNFYANQVENYEQLLNLALEHLNHAEALLSNWSSTTDKVVNHQISTPPRQESLTTTNGEQPEQSSVNLGVPNDTQVLQTQDSSTANADQSKREQADSTPNVTGSFPYPDIPMLPEFQHLTRPEAIQKLLQEHLGTVCHIDFIVRQLYGNLDPHQFKVVKGRVQSTLTQGREANKWSAIPDQPGCYTLILSLVMPNSSISKKRSSKNFKPNSQPQTLVVPMLSKYEGQFLIDALTSLFRENAGKVFNGAEVIEAIYGELNAEQKREVKSKVLNELSRGYRTGRFSKVPEQIGLYTWDANLIIENT